MRSPGYSYEFCGGDASYCILPAEVMECGCLLEYTGEAYYQASLAEPMSCSIGAFRAAYHTQMGVYTHEMGIKEGGKLAIVAGAGPMSLGALTYALHCDRKPGLVVVADINQDRLDRAEHLFSPAEIKAETGIDLVFANNGKMDDPVAGLREISGGTGLDDVLCYAPVAAKGFGAPRPSATCSPTSTPSPRLNPCIAQLNVKFTEDPGHLAGVLLVI